MAGPGQCPCPWESTWLGFCVNFPAALHCFPFYHPARACCWTFASSFGEEPLTSPSVQGSSALTSPLLWLKRCKSGEVSVALSKCWTQPHFVKSKSVKSKQYKLHVWWQVACPDHLGIVPSGVKWILFHQPCVSCITFPQDRITLCSGGAWRR